VTSNIAMMLAVAAALTTAACEKPTAKAPPKPIYISVNKDGKLTVSDTPSDIPVVPAKSIKVTK
jgi:hypothetical protein